MTTSTLDRPATSPAEPLEIDIRFEGMTKQSFGLSIHIGGEATDTAAVHAAIDELLQTRMAEEAAKFAAESPEFVRYREAVNQLDTFKRDVATRETALRELEGAGLAGSTIAETLSRKAQADKLKAEIVAARELAEVALQVAKAAHNAAGVAIDEAMRREHVAIATEATKDRNSLAISIFGRERGRVIQLAALSAIAGLVFRPQATWGHVVGLVEPFGPPSPDAGKPVVNPFIARPSAPPGVI